MRGINIEYFEGILREENLFVFNLAQDKKIRFFFFFQTQVLRSGYSCKGRNCQILLSLVYSVLLRIGFSSPPVPPSLPRVRWLSSSSTSPCNKNEKEKQKNKNEVISYNPRFYNSLHCWPWTRISTRIYYFQCLISQRFFPKANLVKSKVEFVWSPGLWIWLWTIILVFTITCLS